MRVLVGVSTVAGLLLSCLPPAASAQNVIPQLRLVAPAAPGGGWDQTARAMQQALQESGIVRLAPVENIPGAAGTIGLARFIGVERGSADTLMVSGLIMLGGIVMHSSPVTLGDVTPIARLTGEYEVIAVPAASPHRTLADLLAAFKARPESVSWGGGSAGGSDHILAGLVADAVGVPPRRVNYIAFSGGGESLSAILGSQVTAGINGLAEFAPHIEAGTLRALAISSRERLPGVDVPTLREQGVDVELENWRSVVAPPGLTIEEQERLQDILGRMVRSAQWQEILTRYRWLDRFLAGDEFARFGEAEERRVQDILREFGTADGTGTSFSSAGPYPVVVLLGVVVFGLLTVRGIARAAAGAAAAAPAGSSLQPAAWLVAGAAAYLLLAERAGFVIASAVLFWLTSRAFDERHPGRDAAYAAVTSVCIYLLFARVLQVPLASGWLARWL